MIKDLLAASVGIYGILAALTVLGGTGILAWVAYNVFLNALVHGAFFGTIYTGFLAHAAAIMAGIGVASGLSTVFSVGARQLSKDSER